MKEKYFINCSNPEEVETRFQQMTKVLGIDAMPDHLEFKQQFLEEYREKKKTLLIVHSDANSQNREISLEDVILWVRLKKLMAERIGKWIWVRNHNVDGLKTEMQRMGFRFSESKQCWYWRSEKDRSSSSKPIPIDEIRKRYGSKTIDPALL